MKNENQNSFNLDSIEKKNIFLVPVSYFESLDKRIENRILELNASFKKPIFDLPEAYFEQIQVAINQKIAKENVLDNPVLKESVFKMPEGYLVSMEGGIKVMISPEKETKVNPFTIPEDYFGTLSDKIQDKIGEKDNVIKFDFASSPVIRYSIAASVALVLMASSLFFMLKKREENHLSQIRQDDKFANVLLASLDKKEVSLYLEKQEVETHEIIEFASEKKKEKIKNEFEREIISAQISEKEKQAIELELNDIDEFEMPTDI